MKKIFFTFLIILSAAAAFAQSGLTKGESAPSFTATDNSGKTLDLKTLLKTHKAVVLLFYRGQWCPYCNKQMSHLQDSLQMLTAKGAFVVAVTPETDENIGKTVAKTKASFAIIQDKDYSIMKSYKVNYVVAEDLFGRLKSHNIDLEKNNGNSDHVLPVPATYIIDKSGKVTFVHFDKDYTKRPPVQILLNNL